MTSKGLEDTGTWWLETFSRLSFNLYDRSQKEKISLENQFRDAHARQGLAIDRLLGVGELFENIPGPP